jgi:hypothetical protein
MHLRELVWPDNPSLHNYCKDSLQTSISFHLDSAISFFLPAHKPDPLFEGNCTPLPCTNTLDDLALTLHTYLFSCDTLFPLHLHLWLLLIAPFPLILDSSFSPSYAYTFQLISLASLCTVAAPPPWLRVGSLSIKSKPLVIGHILPCTYTSCPSHCTAYLSQPMIAFFFYHPI